MEKILMLSPRAEDYPAKPKVVKQLLRVQKLCVKYNTAIGKLAMAAEAVQRTCKHNFKDLREWSDSHRRKIENRAGWHLFVGRICTKCKVFEPRKEGFAWQVCYECGGEMKHGRAVQRGPARIHTYVCIRCSGEYDTIEK